MCLRLMTALLVMLPVSTGLAQFVAPGGAVPVVANLPGLSDTFWRSDVIILNVGETDTSVMLQLYPEIEAGEATFEAQSEGPIPISAGSQVTLSNIVQSRFGLVDAMGALLVYSMDGTPLVIASRTYTFAGGGSYGQDVSGLLVANQAWVAGLQHDGFYRTNVGIFWYWDLQAEFTISVYDGDGDLVAERVIGFDEAGMQQMSLTSIGVGTLAAGYAVITCSDPDSGWYAWASRVDQATGDAVFRPARGRQQDLP